MPLLTLACSITFTGKIDGYNKDDLKRHIEAAGGTVAKSANANVDLFLAGARASYKKVEKARALGLTIVEGDLLYELLEEGEVEWDDSAPTRSLDALIADARAIEDGAPSNEAWDAICALADECDDDHARDFVAYLVPQLDHWPDVVDYGRTGLGFPPFTAGLGEARLMPADWITAMLNGEMHPKHRLATALSFTSAAVNSTLSTQLFDNPDLAHIRTFDVGSNLGQHVKKRAFYEAMASCPHLGSVESLVLTKAPKGAYDALSTATSMPNLKSVFARPSVDADAADFEAVVFGPWAERLECIGVSWERQAAAVAARLDAFPSLHTLAIEAGHSFRREEDFVDMSRAASPIIERARTLILGVYSVSDYHDGSVGLATFLDRIDTDLDVLDLRGSQDLKAGGRAEVTFWLEHLAENGLGARVGKVFMPSNTPTEVGVALVEASVNALRADGSPFVEASFSFVADPAPGEAERVAANQVHVADAMMFSEPCRQAWDTLTGVVDGLERQLDADAFAEAIGTLEEYLRAWPNDLRVCPRRWHGAFLSETPSPKTRLVRAMEFESTPNDNKGSARVWHRLVEAGNLGDIDHVVMSGVYKTKPFLSGLEAIFEATKPTTYALCGGYDAERRAVKKSLYSSGLLPGAEPWFGWSKASFDDTLEVMSDREVRLEVTDPRDLQSLFDRTDCDHIVSLDLKLYIHSNDDPPGGFDVKPASWARLRHLSVHVTYKENMSQETADAVATWLSRARPIHVGDSLRLKQEYDTVSMYTTPTVELAKAGVYSRAYGSMLRLPRELTLERAAEALGRDDVHVAHVTVEHHHSVDVPGAAELVDAMHPSLREGLRELRWEFTPDAFERVDAILEKLPNLVTLKAIGDGLKTRAARKPFLQALAASEQAGRLLDVTVTGMSEETEKPAAAELKILQKSVAFDPAGWVVGTF